MIDLFIIALPVTTFIGAGAYIFSCDRLTNLLE
jgi:hypothetical protein